MKLSILEALNLSATGFIVVLIILALLAVIIVVLSKLVQLFEGGNKKASNKKKNVKVSEPIKENKPSPAPKTSNTNTVLPAGMVELYKTGYKTAASIMAIVSHESGIPLNKLDFKSIKLKDDVELYKTDDKTAAAIMAIVSHQTDIPLDRLAFKSIKLIEK